VAIEVDSLITPEILKSARYLGNELGAPINRFILLQNLLIGAFLEYESQSQYPVSVLPSLLNR
jgi:hypothetical protein